MGEGDAKATAANVAQLVIEARLIAFAQFARDIQTQASALVVGGKEGFKDTLKLLGRHARAVVEHFEYRQFAIVGAK
jgi:hypothetical protein